MKNRWIAGVLAFAAFTGLMTGCSKPAADRSAAETNAPAAQNNAAAENGGEEEQTPAENGSTFIITLYPEDAPISCENFETLVKEGFYDGLTFHRVVDDFMAQGGDPTGNGTGGSPNTIKGEFSSNGVDNPRKHVRGTVSMARTPDPDSASSQFFICYTACEFLDGSYAAFGEVTEGMEVVDDFLKVERIMGSDAAMSSPTSPIVMEKVEMIDDDADGHPRVQVTMNKFLN
jgi:peptidyl-prolyl cis-trans isomerase B (cyclophilin B)